MSQAENTRATAAGAALRRAEKPKTSPGYLRLAWRRLRRDKLSMMALVMLTAITLLSLAASPITDYILKQDPYRTRVTQKYKPPSREHWLGTDDYGRDTAARLLHAGRVSLYIGVAVTAIALAIGVPLGLLAGYFGGKVDDAINALIQMVINIPDLFLLITLSAIFRPSVNGLALILGATGWAGVARLVRGRVLSERRRDYIDAAVVAGARPGRVMFQHVLPNVASIVLVIIGFRVAGGIIGEAGLSAFGLGVQIPTATWGNMLSRSLDYFERAPHLIVAPGVAIVLTVFSILLFSDGVRDALDPRLNK